MRLIDEEEILRRIQADIDKHTDYDIISNSVRVGLQMAYDDVLLCEIKEVRP